MSNVFMDNVSEDDVYCCSSSGYTLFTLLYTWDMWSFFSLIKLNKIISVEVLSSLLGDTMIRLLFC